MHKLSVVYVSVIVVITACSCSDNLKKSSFSFIENEQGIELFEKGNPVFFYQRKPKSYDGQYVCSNYLHPVYSIDGDTLTQEFPPDHPYHRGVFWTWHQLYVNDKSIGDGWINEGISQNVINAVTKKEKGNAEIYLDVMWKSSTFGDGKPFLKENTRIIVHSLQQGIRKIDFEITLNALVNGFQLGGSADEKGYGGFCARIKLPDDLVFTSEKGMVIPQELQVTAGPWMDFSAGFGRRSGVSGLSILCHPDTPSFPEPWILRQKGSMQNIVFPGKERITIQMDKPVVLKYRMIIHNGNSDSIDLAALQREYVK